MCAPLLGLRFFFCDHFTILMARLFMVGWAFVFGVFICMALRLVIYVSPYSYVLFLF